jgi:hypothetical protein
MEKGAGRGTRRVLPWHSYGSEYSQGTAEGMEGGHVWLTTDTLLQMSPPFPRAFSKMAL